MIKVEDYKIVVTNPGTAAENEGAQWQLAAWLLSFGMEIGTIKNPMEDGMANKCELCQEEAS